jgi:CRP-like cAMP-binding protein
VGTNISDEASGSALDGLGGRIPADAWCALLASGSPRRYASGEALVRQGELGVNVLALNRGLVKVTRLEPGGHEFVLAVRGRGEVIGEATYLGDQVRSATVTAISSCICYTVAHIDFRRIIDGFSLNERVLRHVTERLYESEQIRSELTGLPSRRRIARMLLRFSPGDVCALSQTDIAKAVGLSRSAVAAELAWFRDQDLVVTGRSRVMITNRSRLRRLADGST